MPKPLRIIESQAEIDTYPPFPFPNYSEDDIPNGWEQVGELFCDSSGCGNVGEPALTIGQLRAALEVGKAYAIIDEGQFQLYLGIFVPVRGESPSLIRNTELF